MDVTSLGIDIRSDTQADVLVIGTHGSGDVGQALLGSATEKFVRTSSVPVLVVPEPADCA